jgi:hypothetical protein
VHHLIPNSILHISIFAKLSWALSRTSICSNISFI